MEPLVYGATEDTSSTITVPLGEITSNDINNFALYEGHIWLIKGCSQQETSLKVTLEPLWRLFSRDHVWNGVTYPSKGAFIAAIIQNEYINQSDPFYAYPYLSVVNQDSTSYKAPADEENQIFSLGDYIEEAVKDDGIEIHAEPAVTGVTVFIRPQSSGYHTVIFNDGHTIYEGASFGDGSVGKVTVIYTYNEVRISDDYYLNSEEEIVASPPAVRVEGEWKIVDIGDIDAEEYTAEEARQQAYEKAEEEFKDTINSYKIEWASNRSFLIGDNIRFQLTDGSVHFGKVTYKAKKSSDGLYHYKSGSLKTTLTDKVRGIK